MEKVESYEKFKVKRENTQKNNNNKEKKTREIPRKTKEPSRSSRRNISNIASPYTWEKKKSFVHEKKGTKVLSNGFLFDAKATYKITAEGLDERLVEEVAKRVGGMWTLLG